ncbi:MAG: hypothetical protein R3A48_11975 [Polyangiales bacterium]
MAHTTRGMLTIRDEQMLLLQRDARRRAMLRLRDHLHLACPARAAAMPQAQLLREVEEGVAQAARYGFEAESDLRVFLECRLELGVDFDTRPDCAWAGEILRDDTLFARDKADLLADRHMLLDPAGEP